MPRTPSPRELPAPTNYSRHPRDHHRRGLVAGVPLGASCNLRGDRCHLAPRLDHQPNCPGARPAYVPSTRAVGTRSHARVPSVRWPNGPSKLLCPSPAVRRDWESCGQPAGVGHKCPPASVGLECTTRPVGCTSGNRQRIRFGIQ